MGFFAKIKAKEDARKSKELALAQMKTAKAKKRSKKVNNNEDTMVKRWVKEMEKKAD